MSSKSNLLPDYLSNGSLSFVEIDIDVLPPPGSLDVEGETYVWGVDFFNRSINEDLNASDVAFGLAEAINANPSTYLSVHSRLIPNSNAFAMARDTKILIYSRIPGKSISVNGSNFGGSSSGAVLPNPSSGTSGGDPIITNVDEQNDFIYLGKAISGTLTSDASWRISRIDAVSGDVRWANGTNLFNQVWNDRTSLPYS